MSIINEENYQKKSKKLKTKAYILMAIGICVFLTAIVFVVLTIMGRFEFFLFPVFSFSMVGGFALIGFGGALLFSAKRREIASYQMNAMAPILADSVKYMANQVGVGINKEQNNQLKICPICSAQNEKESKFCKECGYQFDR